MHIQKLLKSLILVMGLFGFSSTCIGEIYIGVGLGQSDSESDDLVGYTEYSGASGEADYDKSGDGYKVFIGHEINDYFAYEGGYLDMGEVFKSSYNYITPDSTGLFYPINTVGSFAVEVSGFYFSEIGQLPLSSLISLNVRAGVFRWDAETRQEWEISLIGVDESIGLSSVSDALSDSGTDLFYGIGIDIWKFGIQYDRYSFEANEYDTDVDYIGAYFKYIFN